MAFGRAMRGPGRALYIYFGLDPRCPEDVPHARTHAGPAAAHLVADRAREPLSPRWRDRLAHRRGPDPPLHLRRHPPPLEAGREGLARARRQARRPDRHACVERLPAPGAVLRRFRHGCRAAHHQPAALPRADHLHRQPCRGPLPVLRRDVRAADREARAPDDLGQGVRRDDRSRAHAGDRRARTSCATRTCVGRAGQRLRVADIPRGYGVLAVLHVRHDREPERRAVFASLDAAALVRDLHGRRHRALGGRVDADGRADVPRQRVGTALCRRDVGREARHARPRARRQERLRTHARREGDARAGRARPSG